MIKMAGIVITDNALSKLVIERVSEPKKPVINRIGKKISISFL